MRNFILNIVVLLFTLGLYSQNTNLKSEEKIETTTIKDSKGEQKIVKKEVVTETQEIKFVHPESKKQIKE